MVCYFLEQERWNCSRFGFDKLRYYDLYKGDFAVEDYATANFSKQQRSIMAQLRAGILSQELEIGRYRNVPLGEMTCKICLSGAVEDVYVSVRIIGILGLTILAKYIFGR